MSLTIIKRVTCDLCGLEEPKSFHEVPYHGEASPFIICANCIKLLGQVNGNALFEFAIDIGVYSRMIERRCEECHALVTEDGRFGSRELFGYIERFKSLLSR